MAVDRRLGGLGDLKWPILLLDGSSNVSIVLDAVGTWVVE